MTLLALPKRIAALLIAVRCIILPASPVRADEFRTGDILECDYNCETPNGQAGYCIGTTTTEVKCLDNGHVISTGDGKFMILLAPNMESLCGGGDTVQVQRSSLSCADGFCRKLDLP